ncbi:DUF2249 domain-containing protein [Microbispora sp. H10836]|uniref:DUF2249 domain-containing protein n=1 Tax=Microbispora sp. H10836 TaxID=2729106 RepID=UPI001B8CD52B|nr:DUF2249 domain-containing protein [Microbispora sp. H10836]
MTVTGDDKAQTTSADGSREASETQEDLETREATVQAIRDHHRKLGRTMADHALTIGRAVDQLSSPSARQATLVAFCREDVLPHAIAEERTLYAAGARLMETALLVRAMTGEHTALGNLVDAVEQARTPGEIAGAAAALDAMFQSHLEKENDILLPALVDAGVDLGALLAGMHEILGESGHTHGSEQHGSAQGRARGHGGCSCTCGGGHDAADAGDASVEVVEGELDVRRLAHVQRHEEIFATFRALRPREAFVLVNDHDPKPLYYQFAARHPGEFDWGYVESGPDVWRVRIGRL